MSSSSASSSNGTSLSGKIARTSKNMLKFSGLTVYQCDYCGITDSILKLCGNCRLVAYCSKECQFTGWKKHKTECKQKNPTHFNKEARGQIYWFLRLAESSNEEYPPELIRHLVNSFRVRCLDEEDLGCSYPEPSEMSQKFSRYLHAAKGTGVLPSTFSKFQFLSLKNDAQKVYRLSDNTQGRSYEDILNNSSITDTNFHADTEETIDDLRMLHTVICGPIQLDNDRLNII